MAGRDYYHQRDAKVAICAELQRRGWKIFGYKEDQSDSMTNYFSPANWDGVAEKDGAVICVDVYPADVTNRSGGFDSHNYLPDADCPHCNGTGNEPNGWTLAQARELPEAFNSHRTKLTSPGAVNLMRSVVSPIHFKDNGMGAEKCHKCHGSGHTLKKHIVRVYWPTFQVNPKGAKWHVERNGKILDKGIGLSSCLAQSSYDAEEKAKAAKALTALADRMEAAAFGKSSPQKDKSTKSTAKPNTTPTGPVMAKFTTTGAWTWLTFTSKPSDEVLAIIKGDGWRWSKKRSAWYNLDGKTPPACVTYSQTA